MRIRTQFIVTMLLFGVVLAAGSASAIVTNQQVERASAQENIASRIAQGASELSYLANDWVIYQETQQLERWQARFASFSNDVARLQADNPEQQAFVRNIQASTQRLKEVFDSVVAAVGSSSNHGGAIDPALLRVSWSRLAVQSQGLASDASRLFRLVDDQEAQLQQMDTLIVIALIAVFAVYFLVNYLMIQRRTFRSIAKLQAGAAVIGSGNLDFRVEEKQNDEIGDLSRAFNRMTADLKTVITTKADLEQEILKRNEVEEELRVSNEHLREQTIKLEGEVEERKQAEEVVEKVAQEWSTTFDAISDFISIHDANYRIVRTNRAFAAAVGISGQDIIGLPCYQCVHGTDQPWPDCPHRVALESKKTFSTQFYEPRLGMHVEVACSPIFDENGETTGTVHVIRDITERKKAEEALHRVLDDLVANEERLKRSQELAHLGSWELDLIDNTLSWSDEVYRIFGLEPQEFEATYEAFLEAVHPDDRQAVDDAYSGSLREGLSTYEIEHRVVRRHTGEIRYVYEKCEHVRDDNGKVTRSIGMVLDVTERKKAEEEIRQRTAELEASNRELEAFSYSVSHDLRAPLRSMEGFSSALLEDYAEKLDEQGKQYLRYIQESSELMAQLIDDLLKLSRVTRSEMNYERVNLNEMAWEIIAEMEKAEPHRKVTLNIATGITAYGDRSLLRLALENLLGNAWKFSSKAGSPRIEMGTVASDNRQTYFVRDNGVGFDMTYVDKLFRPFQRLHKTTEFAGTGIGLATVQRIINRHGGEVWAESKVGEGATFYFTLGG